MTMEIQKSIWLLVVPWNLPLTCLNRVATSTGPPQRTIQMWRRPALSSLTRTAARWGWWGQRWLKPDFLYVIRLAPGANQRQNVFTLSEITFLFTQYILSRRNLIFDHRNKLVALVENDPLGKAFGVKAFHRDQALRLIHTQITPVMPIPVRTLNVLASTQGSNGPLRDE